MAIQERWKKTRPIKITTEAAVAGSVAIFSSDPRILAAYLFGSRARYEDHPESDIDLAFHTDQYFKWDDYYLLWRSISKDIRSDRFDLLWLDTASPDIVFDVIKYGKLVFHRDNEALNNFELYSKKRFWDYRVYLRKSLPDSTWENA
jgi:predicted nucleotidyltransferase